MNQAAAAAKLENVDKPLELFANHSLKVFNSLRNSIKKHNDMFLFGEPTENMMKLLLLVYHENIIRLLSSSTDKPGEEGKKHQCMFGIMEDSKGDLYVTISESPGFDKNRNSPTDGDFLEKRIMMNNILESANVDVEFPEFSKKTYPSDNNATVAAKFIRPAYSDENLWRKGERGGVDPNTVREADKIRRTIESKPELKNAMFYNDDASDKINIYDPSIRNMNMKVKWIDSAEYLARLRKGEGTFPPYKKMKKETGTFKTECNNGHLCTESKLFAYAALNKLKYKSFVAYWIGNNLPPEGHIIRSYCYRTKKVKNTDNLAEIAEENKKLIVLTKRCLAPLQDGRKLPEPLQGKGNLKNVMKNVVQPIAVACPGCFANITAYQTGKFSTWNHSDCYVFRRASGGSRKTKKRAAKKRTTRKH
jgi:hypothetical protein